MKNKLTIQNAHLFLEEIYINNQEKKNINQCDECGNLLTIDNYFYVCTECGTMDVSNPLSNDDEYICVSKKTLYKRRNYCIEKLKMMSCHKQSNSPKYMTMIEKLKDYEICDIHELKKLIKKLKYSVYYKYIYCIYKDLTGEKLIDLTYSDILKLSDNFVRIEGSFKLDQKNRKNMISYDLIIRNIMKEMGYRCYKNVIIPKKNKIIRRIYKSIKN